MLMRIDYVAYENRIFHNELATPIFSRRANRACCFGAAPRAKIAEPALNQTANSKPT